VIEQSICVRVSQLWLKVKHALCYVTLCIQSTRRNVLCYASRPVNVPCYDSNDSRNKDFVCRNGGTPGYRAGSFLSLQEVAHNLEGEGTETHDDFGKHIVLCFERNIFILNSDLKTSHYFFINRYLSKLERLFVGLWQFYKRFKWKLIKIERVPNHVWIQRSNFFFFYFCTILFLLCRIAQGTEFLTQVSSTKRSVITEYVGIRQNQGSLDFR